MKFPILGRAYEGDVVNEKTDEKYYADLISDFGNATKESICSGGFV